MHGMTIYFIRRLMLIPVTFVCITFLVYSIIRMTPGGPIEQAEIAMKMGQASEGGGGSSNLTGEEGKLNPQQVAQLKQFFQIHRSIPVGYMVWLGVWPKTVLRESFDAQGRLTTLAAEARAALAGREQTPAMDAYLRMLDHMAATAPRVSFPDEVDQAVSATTTISQVITAGGVPLDKVSGTIDALREIRRDMFEYDWDGVLQGEFGLSTQQNTPVLNLIFSKFKISLFFGLIGFTLAYTVCIPLGVVKAIKHRSVFDVASSMAVFLGYAIPGFVACLVILQFFGGPDNWFPLGGWRPEAEVWDQLGFLGKVKAQIEHMFVPIFGYVMGSFATMTILMKNSLLENLGADYVRTAFAKGLPERRVIFLHALRNSLIPITAGIGHALGLLFAGSFLIEKVCNIPGMGLLGFDAIIQRDMFIIMGILVFTSLIMLTGNIISDLIWAMIDPRIRFGGSRR